MYQELVEFDRVPAPFSRYTVDTLWTDPHIGRQMLGFHLDPAHDAASRKATTIDATVGWMDARFGLAAKRMVDLGCGPGLYATRFAGRGAKVTGMDFSPVSIAYAREHVPEGAALDYVQGDYLKDALPAGADIVTQIYGDYCALSPDRRKGLLGSVREALAPGGRYVFDVYSPGQLAAISEATEYGHRYMHGFWSPNDYFGFKKTVVYRDEMISLERYMIVEAARQIEVFNWMQYYTPESITSELAESGFVVEAVLDLTSGAAWTGDASPFFVVARRG